MSAVVIQNNNSVDGRRQGPGRQEAGAPRPLGRSVDIYGHKMSPLLCHQLVPVWMGLEAGGRGPGAGM